MVQAVAYLLFNEGYSSTNDDRLIRQELCEEAVRLALILAEHPWTQGPRSSALLALMLFHASRLETRLDELGRMTTAGRSRPKSLGPSDDSRGWTLDGAGMRR